MAHSERKEDPAELARRAKREARLEKEIGEFMHEYSRKSRRGFANDRRYSREVESFVKRMLPEDLDALLRGERDDEEAAW